MDRPFSELVDAEVPGAGAQGDGHVTGTRRNLAGIALSGGGIRSATFNLGLLQGLDDLGLLRGFDYLSTVSGGGYVGGFWTRWRSRRAADDPGDFPPREEGVPCEDLRHLRRFSNFLTPRLGILSVDTGRAVVAVLGGTVPALLAAFSAGILAFAVWLAAGWALLARPFADVVDGRLEAAAPFAVMALLTAAGLLGGEHVWRRTARDGRWGLYLWTAAVATAASAGVFGMVEASREAADPLFAADLGLPLTAKGASPTVWIHLFTPALAWLAAAGVLVLRRFLVSSATRTLRHRERADAFDRTQSRLLLFAGVWSAAALVWILGAAATAGAAIGAGVAERVPGLTGLAGTAAAAAALFAWIRKRADDTGPIQAGAKLLARLGPLLPQVLAYLAVAAAAALNAAVFVAVGTTQPDGAKVLFAAALAVTLAVLLFMDPQEIGLHSFYRTRLVRAFLGASNADARFRSEEHDGDDVPLDALAGRGDGPVHLICCAANDLATDRLFENLQRGAVSGVLSPVGYSVGSEWARWSPEAETPSLGAAMTASAAAFNSLMGARTIQYGPAVTFLATALNLRLGMWLPHPRRIPPPPRKIPLAVPFVGDAADGPRRSVRLPRPRFPGSRFYREMFGLARADGRGPVHLSDGGHFENLGVYELIRRHCTFILASDCGQDAAVAFDDVGNLVRKVREDFGVDVRIDLSLLRPGPDGRAARHMVAGDIHYPDGETGTLLLFKPSLAGGEPADVQQYASRNAVFPHESTGDQFYDEAQWEAYRSLGEHAVRVAFERLMGGLPPREAPRPRLAEAFARARFEWLTGTGFGERSAGLGKRIGELDALLLTPGCAALRAEVFRELPEPAPAAPWTDEALPASLGAVRAALRMMEDAFRSEGLEREGSHPAYLPLLNHFGRWTSAPLLRAWWPLLRTLHGQPFARWLESTFGLRSPGGAPDDGDGLAEVALLPLDLRPTGFASRAWAASRPFPEAGDERIGLSYELRLDHGGRDHRVQAGLLLCHVRPGLLAWEAGDFFVPPGLWGCGFGTDFMRRLGCVESTPFLGGEVNARGVLLARVPCDPEGSAEQRRRAANEVRMYRGSGFREALADDGMLVAAGGPELVLDMRDLPAAVLRSGTRWMVAEREGAAVGAAVP